MYIGFLHSDVLLLLLSLFSKVQRSFIYELVASFDCRVKESFDILSTFLSRRLENQTGLSDQFVLRFQIPHKRAGKLTRAGFFVQQSYPALKKNLLLAHRAIIYNKETMRLSMVYARTSKADIN